MNIKMLVLLLLCISIDCLGMSRPVRSQKVITSTRGLPARTVTKKLQDFLNNNEMQQILGRRKTLEEIEKYIEQCANPNIKTKNGTPLLHFVFSDINSLKLSNSESINYHQWVYKVMEKIIMAGGDVNATDRLGSSLLFEAVNSLQVPLVKLLLEHGARVTPDIVTFVSAPGYQDLKAVIDTFTKKSRIP